MTTATSTPPPARAPGPLRRRQRRPPRRHRGRGTALSADLRQAHPHPQPDAAAGAAASHRPTSAIATPTPDEARRGRRVLRGPRHRTVVVGGPVAAAEVRAAASTPAWPPTCSRRCPTRWPRTTAGRCGGRCATRRDAPGRSVALRMDALRRRPCAACPTGRGWSIAHNVESVIWQRYYETEANAAAALVHRPAVAEVRALRAAGAGRGRPHRGRQRPGRGTASRRLRRAAGRRGGERRRSRLLPARRRSGASRTASSSSAASTGGRTSTACACCWTASSRRCARPSRRRGCASSAATRRSGCAQAAAAPGVELHADVPDVRPFLAQCGMMVVPLRIGGGSRLKILEALAMQHAGRLHARRRRGAGPGAGPTPDASSRTWTIWSGAIVAAVRSPDAAQEQARARPRGGAGALRLGRAGGPAGTGVDRLRHLEQFAIRRGRRPHEHRSPDGVHVLRRPGAADARPGRGLADGDRSTVPVVRRGRPLPAVPRRGPAAGLRGRRAGARHAAPPRGRRRRDGRAGAPQGRRAALPRLQGEPARPPGRPARRRPGRRGVARLDRRELPRPAVRSARPLAPALDGPGRLRLGGAGRARCGAPACGRSACAVIHNAVDPERFDESDPRYRAKLLRYFRAAATRIVGAAGRLSPEKGFDVLVDAAERVREARPVGRLRPLRRRRRAATRLRGRSRTPGLGGSFVLAGFRSRPRPLLAASSTCWRCRRTPRGCRTWCWRRSRPACRWWPPPSAARRRWSRTASAASSSRPATRRRWPTGSARRWRRRSGCATWACSGRQRVQEQFTFAAQARAVPRPVRGVEDDASRRRRDGQRTTWLRTATNPCER